jgi:hypothetical protein
MKRSTWISIGVTVAVLLAAGNLSRVRWSEMRLPAWHLPAPGSGRLAADMPVQRKVTAHPGVIHLKPVPASLLVTPFASGTRPSLPIPSLPLTAALVTALLASLSLGVAWRMHGDRRGRVFQMARRGLPTSRIAGRARVPQDAVRTLLTPGMGTRR